MRCLAVVGIAVLATSISLQARAQPQSGPAKVADPIAAAQARAAEAFAIHDPNGIDDEQFIPINGADQWVTIRGRDRANPVILVVGGFGVDGPGAVASPFLAPFQGWEPYFTVVQWDMRGAGKTFSKADEKLDPDLGVDMLMRDALTLTDELRRRLGKRKIVLLGTGFGSTLAAQLVRQHPERYSAYVAAGQIADPRVARESEAVRYLRELATAKGDKATLADLALAGPHPFADNPRDPSKIDAFRRAYARYRPRIPQNQGGVVMTAPHWTVTDAVRLSAGMAASEEKFGAVWNRTFDFASLRGVYRVPIFLIQGDFDIDAPLAFSKAWLDKVQAPSKSLTVISGAGDHAIQTDPETFVRVLRDEVRPVAMKEN
jgi:pimeloyl-ACP methyl ester carboxylesterase